MSENVRERIEGVLQACLVKDPAFITDERFSRLTENGTQNIIDIVRDALLSKAAVEAGEATMIRYDWANAPYAKSWNVIEDALAAAGLADTRREQGDGYL